MKFSQDGPEITASRGWSTYDPAVLGAELSELGYGWLEDLGQDEINARYFAERADGLGVGTLYRLVSASLGGRS